MRETLGHRIAHIAIALICFTRAFAYSEVLRPPRDWNMRPGDVQPWIRKEGTP